ncbi:MAG: hypothetical protein IPM53_26660 [Anaerolineaceae bacterium]|nr:hypothetical protein [Anaerolineaceae bacterium]
MDNTKVADLTVDEFRSVIRETVAQTLAELLSDPDEGLTLREELSSELLAALKEPKAQYKTAQTVAENLGLDW